MRFGIRAAAGGRAAAGRASGSLLFARAPVDGTFVVDVLPGMLLLGFGAGMAFNPVLLAAMSDVEPSESGLASGVVNTVVHDGRRARARRSSRASPPPARTTASRPARTSSSRSPAATTLRSSSARSSPSQRRCSGRRCCAPVPQPALTAESTSAPRRAPRPSSPRGWISRRRCASARDREHDRRRLARSVPYHEPPV